MSVYTLRPFYGWRESDINVISLDANTHDHFNNAAAGLPSSDTGTDLKSVQQFICSEEMCFL